MIAKPTIMIAIGQLTQELGPVTRATKLLKPAWQRYQSSLEVVMQEHHDKYHQESSLEGSLECLEGGSSLEGSLECLEDESSLEGSLECSEGGP